MEQLKVFDELPPDEINSRIHETFTASAPAPMIHASQVEWNSLSSRWRRELQQKCFGGWPDESTDGSRPPELNAVFDTKAENVRFVAYDFESQTDITLRLYLVLPDATPTKELDAIVLHPLDAPGWSDFLAAMQTAFAEQIQTQSLPEPSAEKYAQIQRIVSKNRGLAYFAPRGIGHTDWDPSGDTHIRRRFMLLGQTLDGMRVWDVRRAIQALRMVEGLADTPVRLNADRNMAGIALYAALFEPGIETLDLHELPESHRQGPDFLNVLRILDMPQTVAMVVENSPVRIHQKGAGGWEYPFAVADELGWDKRITIQNRSPRND